MVSSGERVTVEFFGVPRLRAGRAELTVEARTVAEVLAAVERACPGLAGLVQAGRLAPHYLLSINGQRFVTDGADPLKPGERVLLLSADAGG
jgi:molybdopterin converting factor small subunit